MPGRPVDAPCGGGYWAAPGLKVARFDKTCAASSFVLPSFNWVEGDQSMWQTASPKNKIEKKDKRLPVTCMKCARAHHRDS